MELLFYYFTPPPQKKKYIRQICLGLRLFISVFDLFMTMYASFSFLTERNIDAFNLTCRLSWILFFIQQFITGLADITSLLGSTVELRCQHQATSSFKLKWSQSRLSVLYSSNDIIFLDDYPDIKRRISITGDHKIGEYHLSISDVRKSDAGNYECLVGSNIDNNQLTVIGMVFWLVKTYNYIQRYFDVKFNVIGR